MIWGGTENFKINVIYNLKNTFIQRFKSLEKRFPKNPEFFNMYRTQINDYITSGHAELLSFKEKNNTSAIINYIPHYGMLNINKPDGVRVVFGASAKINKTCSNDNPLPDIDLLNNLLSVIKKFRNGKYVIIGYIEKNVPSSFCRSKRR